MLLKMFFSVGMLLQKTTASSCIVDIFSYTCRAHVLVANYTCIYLLSLAIKSPKANFYTECKQCVWLIVSVLLLPNTNLIKLNFL